MSRIFHIWWLVIIAIIVIALIVVWAFYSGSQTLSANSLYDAVNSSAMYAREKGSRMDRGTFVINKKLFEDRLQQYKIKGYGKVGSGSGYPTKLYVHYLTDNNKSNNVNSGSNTTINDEPNLQNGHVGADNYNNPSNDVPIRAIQVSADSYDHKIDYNNRSNVSDAKNKYVATDVVQESDEDYKNNSTDYNQPVRNPNKNTSDSDDPTINRFNGTDGSSFESNPSQSATKNGEAVDASD